MTETPSKASPLKIYYSRSAVVADWTCPRKRYWNYEYAGRGITATTTGLELFLGTTVHDGLAALAHGIDIDQICQAANAQLRERLTDGAGSDPDAMYFANEQCSLVEGLLRGYNRHVWPSFTVKYPETIAVEKEFVYEHDGLSLMSKPDLIVRDKDGCLWYVEYKTSSTNKEKWINSWASAIQLHSSIRAVEQSLGEKLTGVLVQCLYKGYISYEKQNSPFCYAYHRPGEPPFSKPIWAYEYKAGLKRFPVWLREGGVKQWVDGMPTNLLSQQFPAVPPIFINDALIDVFFRQQSRREHEIRNARKVDEQTGQTYFDQESMDQVFPQHFENCSPGWGYGCAFKKLCHGNIADPLKAGFELRHSHHQVEEDALNESD